MSNIRFLSAIDFAVQGNPNYLARYLRSEDPLTPTDRECLARFVEGALARKKGRPPDSLSRRILKPVAAAAREFDELKASCAEAGKKYGIRNSLIEKAAERHGVDPNSLDNYLRRTGRKRGRKPDI